MHIHPKAKSSAKKLSQVHAERALAPRTGRSPGIGVKSGRFGRWLSDAMIFHGILFVLEIDACECIRAYICVYAYMYICKCIYVYVYIYICMYRRIYA